MARHPDLSAIATQSLELLPRKGVAHDHVRLGSAGTGLIARIPRWSQLGLDAATHLAMQAEAFCRAAPSGHTPRLIAIIPADGDHLPMGALVVSEVQGRTPVLPQDMAAIATALGAIHRLPVPDDGDRPPLPSPPDAAAATLAHVQSQAFRFSAANLAPATLEQLEEELDNASRFQPDSPAPVTLVGSDTHPGNYLIADDGRAWFTDLEKAQYGNPAIDLAHASLYTSTRWEREVACALTPDQVAAFITTWEQSVPAELALATRPWLRPMRRLTWLRTMTWMARWAVEGRRLAPDMPDAVAAHMDAHVHDVFLPDTISLVRADWR